jgi:hypothetical protein
MGALVDGKKKEEQAGPNNKERSTDKKSNKSEE